LKNCWVIYARVSKWLFYIDDDNVVLTVKKCSPHCKKNAGDNA